VVNQIVTVDFATGSAVRLEAVFDADWTGASQVGLWLNAGQQDEGYQFVLRLGDRERKSSSDGDDEQDTVAFDFAIAREHGINAIVEIRKGGSLLLRRELDLSTLHGDDLSMMVTRQRDQLEFQLNAIPAFKVRDVFALSTNQKSTFAVDWPSDVGIRRLRGYFLATPPDPRPLQRADELHDLEDYAAALDLYKELQRTVDDVGVRLEASYKQGVCLAALVETNGTFTNGTTVTIDAKPHSAIRIGQPERSRSGIRRVVAARGVSLSRAYECDSHLCTQSYERPGCLMAVGAGREPVLRWAAFLHRVRTGCGTGAREHRSRRRVREW
jgi:hypothetical protein